ncbi:Protein CBR-SARS-2 [Caenorhabditis briggsae]|uniref:serine--tRNA ligase n=1 Tax=Caenorhabditis briggsae TaxID=6238 RepID=A8WR43_CAEBR|nr:Protein CBR-SARS-2 [Caenorhabditis briggsae]CAP22951.2 Protein CBR-SARS-2 [Caenorhabditis briggsae]
MRRLYQLALRSRNLNVGLARRFTSTEASTSEEDSTPPTLRPDLNFEFLLNEKNIEAIKENILNRKGVGDIDKVHEKWAVIQKMMNSGEKPNDINEQKYAQLWNELYDEAILIPNMTQDGVPQGSEENAKKVSEWGDKREDDCLTAEKLVQNWRSLLHPTEASGQRSYVFLGSLASLEKALLDYAYERVCALGFRPITVPDLVSGEVTQACGVMQRSEHPIQYTLAGDEAHTKLSGTAEMGIAAFLRGRTFQEEQLPIRLVSLSRCFRTEISKSASEAKLYRVHEFSKVEMFVVCTPEQSLAELDYVVEVQKGTFQALGIHCRYQKPFHCHLELCIFRQLEMPSEELGASAAKKFDIEAWMPGRKLYGEVSSASNCTDFQARRLGIKYKTADGTTKYVHTCNGTALSSTRTLISVLETFQNVSVSMITSDRCNSLLQDKKGLGELPDPLRKRIKQRGGPLRFQPAKSLA